ncbi:MAG: EamA family transporter [Chloroflexi bacterium]|jgi:drug/metabolite transporter (DMT)-like permease|nr:EamA family transporter [Chloroflexota bacterium]
MTEQAPPKSGLPERPVLIAFLIFVLVGGGASIAIRVTYGELAPFWSAASRFALAAIVFWILAFIKKIPLPKGRALLGALIFGILTIGLAFLLIAWGLVATPASIYQILMALVPLLTIFLSTIHGIEAITRRGLVGSLLAVIGIAITVGGASTADISLPHIAAILVAAAFVAEGGVLIKRFPPNPPIMTNAIGMTAGAIILGAVSLLSGEEWTIPTQTDTWIAFIYLVVFVTILVFLLYMYVLSNWTASGTSYGFVLVPLVTIVLAATLVGEKITVNFLIGAAFVLVGVLVGALLPSKTKPEIVEECKDRSGQVLPRCI